MLSTTTRLGHLLPQEFDSITLIYCETVHDILWNTIDYFTCTVIPIPCMDNPAFLPIHWLALLDAVELPHAIFDPSTYDTSQDFRHQHDHCGKTEARESNMCTLYDVHFIVLLIALLYEKIPQSTLLKMNARSSCCYDTA